MTISAISSPTVRPSSEVAASPSRPLSRSPTGIKNVPDILTSPQSGRSIFCVSEKGISASGVKTDAIAIDSMIKKILAAPDLLHSLLDSNPVNERMAADTIHDIFGKNSSTDIDTAIRRVKRAGAEKADAVVYTKEEMKGVLLIYQTNAGASAINGRGKKPEPKLHVAARREFAKALEGSAYALSQLRIEEMGAASVHMKTNEGCARLMNEALKTCPPAKGLSLYRGTRLTEKLVSELSARVGSANGVSTDFFMSTSPDQKTAHTFAGTHHQTRPDLDQTMPVVYEITANGYDIGGRLEQEIVLPIGTKLQVALVTSTVIKGERGKIIHLVAAKNIKTDMKLNN